MKIKIPLKTVRLVICLFVAGLFLLLPPFLYVLPTSIGKFAIFIILTAFSLFYLIFWCCPYCGKHLGNLTIFSNPPYCRYCGKKLDWTNDTPPID